MIRRPLVDLFCEDSGHESFARALLQRLATDSAIPRPIVNVRSARGGHGRAISELRSWQRTLPKGASPSDLLLVLIDGNGEGWAQQRSAVSQAIVEGRFSEVVIGCPDPHIEAWFAADLGALERLTGARPPAPPAKPGRFGYKNWLKDALEAADFVTLTEGTEIAGDLLPEMDLFRAGTSSPSLGHLVKELSAALRRMR
jgi:hypothetical protein